MQGVQIVPVHDIAGSPVVRDGVLGKRRGVSNSRKEGVAFRLRQPDDGVAPLPADQQRLVAPARMADDGRMDLRLFRVGDAVAPGARAGIDVVRD